ncbi:hypothetical protein MASR2M78_11290 [Treponema sp.]
MIALQIYLYLSLLWVSYISKNTIKDLACTISPREAGREEECSVSLSGNRIRMGLGLVDQISIKLRTFDGRMLETHLENKQKTAQFKAPKRGAYYAPFDFYRIMDVFGFFQVELPLDADKEARLLVIAEESATLVETSANSGGNKPRTETHFHRNDDLTESRPYAPGDDTRRINWKLLGHADELFVRVAELENPPKSYFAVLVDSSVDPDIFKENIAPDALDPVCALALRLINEIRGSSECLFAYNGSSLLGQTDGKVRSSAIDLALPAALSLGTAQDLPKLQAPLQSCIIFLLPRKSYGNTAIDRFIENHRDFDIELVIISTKEGDQGLIEECISDNLAHYSRGKRLRARRA